MSPKKILIILLNSNGDCLYGTVIAKQLKKIDYPGCHLTWAVNKKCKQSIENNPWIDVIWEIDTKKTITDIEEWNSILILANEKKKRGDFDDIFCLQIQGDNILKFDGGIRSTIYKNYPHPISIFQQPEIYLHPEEIDRVAEFASKYNLSQYKHVVLIECGPESFTSNLHPKNILPILEELIQMHKDIGFILSSNKKINYSHNQIIDGSELSFRENAELTKYCHLFVGCSSGITWLTTTQWAKVLPKVILTNPKDFYSSSFIHDQRYADLTTENVIEIQTGKNDLKTIKETISLFTENKFFKAKELYHREFVLKNYKFVYRICKGLIMRGKLFAPINAFRNVCSRNGFSWKGLGFLLKGYLKSPVYIFQKKED